MIEDYQRVTEIISPFTGIEFVPEDILNHASQRGSEVHRYIEAFFEGWPIHVMPQQISYYYASFLHFWESSKHQFDGGEIQIEKRVNCPDLMVTGCADLVAVCEGRTYLIDWKTSASFHKSWYVQGAAYKHLFELNEYENVDDVLFVKLKKDGSPPSLYKSKDQGHLDIFFKCVELYRYFEMDKTRKKRN